jgi:TNF receptor-associated protein 1
MFISYPIKLNG